MPATEAQVDSIKEDIRALSDTVSEILVTVNGLTSTVNRLTSTVNGLVVNASSLTTTVNHLVFNVKDHGKRLDKVEGRLDGMDSAIQEILTLVKRGS